MVSLQYFVCCVGLENTPERVVITQPISAIHVEFLPTLYSFHVFFTLLGLTDGVHSVEIRISGPDGALVSQMNTEINFKQDERETAPAQYVGLNVGVNINNLKIEREGAYQIVVLVDGESTEPHSFYIDQKAGENP